MIVVSAALVVVALGLLVVGWITEVLRLVYASIGVCLIATVLLAVGVFLRRAEIFGGGRAEPVDRSNPARSAGAAEPAEQGVGLAEPVGPAGPQPGQGAGAARPAGQAVRTGAVRTEAPSRRPVEPESQAGDGGVSGEVTSGRTSVRERLAATPPAGRLVLVVPGRRRYHGGGCVMLLGHQTEELTVDEAREEGFTACTVCTPDGAPRTRPAGRGSGAPAGAEPPGESMPRPAPPTRTARRPEEPSAEGAGADATPEPADHAAAGGTTSRPSTAAETDEPRPATAAATGSEPGPARDEAAGSESGPARDEAVGPESEPGRNEAVGSESGPGRDEAVGSESGPARDEAVGSESGPARDEAVGSESGPGRDEAAGSESEPAAARGGPSESESGPEPARREVVESGSVQAGVSGSQAEPSRGATTEDPPGVVAPRSGTARQHDTDARPLPSTPAGIPSGGAVRFGAGRRFFESAGQREWPVAARGPDGDVRPRPDASPERAADQSPDDRDSPDRDSPDRDDRDSPDRGDRDRDRADRDDSPSAGTVVGDRRGIRVTDPDQTRPLRFFAGTAAEPPDRRSEPTGDGGPADRSDVPDPGDPGARGDATDHGDPADREDSGERAGGAGPVTGDDAEAATGEVGGQAAARPLRAGEISRGTGAAGALGALGAFGIPAGRGAVSGPPARSGQRSGQRVHVVRGVPRYHRSECVLIRAADREDVAVMTPAQAADQGCTPCMACQPDTQTIR